MRVPAVVTTIQHCPRNDRPAAVRELHSGLSPQKQAELVIALQQAPPDDDDYWAGLLVAGPTDRPAAVAWVQPLAGNTGLLWPPAADASHAVDLFRAAGAFAQSQELPLVQLLADETERVRSECLAAGGFGKLAKLAYMAADARSLASDATVQFESGAGQNHERLAALIEQTYRGTLDCPQLDGVRSLSDSIAGYRAQGVHLPRHWYFVRRDQVDVGVLLLTSHPATCNWELVYMGVAPEARGAGLGRRIVEFAVNAAYCGGATQIVLAVDAENGPAIRAYESAGFGVWEHRLVYGRVASAA